MARFLSVLPLFALALASAPVIAQGFPDVPAMVNGAVQSSVAQAQNVAHAGSTDNPALAYKLGAADKVRIIVYNEEALSGEFTVNSDGNLSLPLIGDIPVSGKTTSEVIKDVTRDFADGYLRDPKISLDVLTYRPFFILGEVTKPGEYPYTNGLTVMNAVATATGFTYRADKKKVFIRRAGTTAEKKYELTADLSVAPGDTVRIGERYF